VSSCSSIVCEQLQVVVVSICSAVCVGWTPHAVADLPPYSMHRSKDMCLVYTAELPGTDEARLQAGEDVHLIKGDLV
jgi:hypothetical protein